MTNNFNASTEANTLGQARRRAGVALTAFEKAFENEIQKPLVNLVLFIAYIGLYCVFPAWQWMFFAGMVTANFCHAMGRRSDGLDDGADGDSGNDWDGGGGGGSRVECQRSRSLRRPPFTHRPLRRRKSRSRRGFALNVQPGFPSL